MAREKHWGEGGGFGKVEKVDIGSTQRCPQSRSRSLRSRELEGELVLSRTARSGGKLAAGRLSSDAGKDASSHLALGEGLLAQIDI